MSRKLAVNIVGAGPGGLYLAISLKLRNPAHAVAIYERNQADDTFGWGVVFSDQTLEGLRDNDPDSAAAIFESFAHWDDIDVVIHGQRIRSGGHGFCGIARKRLLELLQSRAAALGVDLHFGTEVDNLEQLRAADLVVASDGINSRIRERHAQVFEPNIDVRRNRFVWYGTHQTFDAFTFAFEQTPAGWIWAHAYRFDRDTSTFIVECSPQTWQGLGLDTADSAASMARCEQIFAAHLGGHRLLSNAAHRRGSEWLSFPRLTCRRWHDGNLVLLGDAAHTAHFSIGSGTKLALEDAIDLARLLDTEDDLDTALEAYHAARHTEVLKIQSAARNSTEWFENLPRYTHLEPLQFAYSLLTRSQRVSHENLRVRDSRWLTEVESWFAQRAERALAADPAQPVDPSPRTDAAVPPMFTPLRLRGLTLANRVVVSPMATYSASDGTPGDFHLVHYGARAQGGAALVMTEMTCVTAQGRITPGCAGMYTPAHERAWRRITGFVHTHTDARIALQLGHSGPKGSTRVGWEGMDVPLEAGNWPLIAASAVPWAAHNQVPRALTEADMHAVTAAFVAAAEMAERADFDMLELHCAHGYLLSSFITPIGNRRTDAYGGPLENRLRFPLQVFAAVRAAWPAARPMSVRISATDWVADGLSAADAVATARAFHAAGADIIDVSAGQTTPDARPVYGRMFQTPLSDQIRNEAGVPTMAVGNIYDIDHVNSIIAAGRADLCCLARPHLSDPYWTLRAAAEQGYAGVAWPKPYQPGRAQLERNMQRVAEMIERI